MRFDRCVYVATSDAAYQHNRKVIPSTLTLRWEEFMAVAGGVDEADGLERHMRLVEALSYFAVAQGLPPFEFYGAVQHNQSGRVSGQD